MKNLVILLSVLFLFACGNTAEPTAATNATGEPAVATKPATKPTVQTTKPQVTTRPGAKNPMQRTPPKQVSLADYKAKNEGWMVDFEKAKALSEKTGKPIMANFTGSDWCGWCKKLDRSVFHQDGFQEWADKNVVLLELDFPRRFKVPNEIAQQNNGLKQAFKVRGFPSIWVFDASTDAEGKLALNGLGKTGYTKTLGEFTNTIDGFIAKRPK